MQMAHPRVLEEISIAALKALVKNPAERYSSGQQFFAALEEAAKAAPVSRANSTGSIPAYKDGPWAERKPGNQSSAFAKCQPVIQSCAGTERQPEFQSDTVRVGEARLLSSQRPERWEQHTMVPGKTGARKPVSTANHWKVVAAVVGGLCLIVVLALLFQRHPAEQEDAAAPVGGEYACSVQWQGGPDN